jgi:hypothetical protein
MKKTLLATAALLLTFPASASPLDNGLMTQVPNVGVSRIESVNYCLKFVGVDRYQDLMTDSEFVNFEACLIDLT